MDIVMTDKERMAFVTKETARIASEKYRYSQSRFNFQLLIMSKMAGLDIMLERHSWRYR